MLPVFGHLDLTVDYNLDTPELDTGAWSPNMTYTRLHYARSPAGTAPPKSFDTQLQWGKFSTDDNAVDVVELARWLKNVRPKSVQDLKPLLLLLQGTLTKFVDGDIKFWSSEAAELRLQNEKMVKLLNEQNEEIEKLRRGPGGRRAAVSECLFHDEQRSRLCT